MKIFNSLLIISFIFLFSNCEKKECDTFAGTWSAGNGCLGEITYHVDQEKCELYFQEDLDFKAWVKQDTVYIKVNEDFRCKGSWIDGEDFGTDSTDPCDYPQIGIDVAKAVSRSECEQE